MCPWSRRIHALHDGESFDAAAVEAHLAECADCAKELAELRKLSGALMSFSPAGADETTTRRWRAAMRREQAGELLLIRLSLRVTGIAAALAVGAGAWIWMNSPARPAPEAPAGWEQTALLAGDDSVEFANGPDADSPDVELAQWIVTDLSGVQR